MEIIKKNAIDYKHVVRVALDALENIKGENIVVLNTEQLSSLFSVVIVCTGNSSRQVSALANSVLQSFKQQDIDIVGMEGNRSGEWVLVDGGDVIVHIMLPHVREYYSLETLWNGDATKN